MTIRLAILECDTPLPNTAAKYGGYAGVFEKLLRLGASSSRKAKEWEERSQVSKYQVQLNPDEYPSIEGIDAILITGSKYSAFEDDPWIKTLVAFTAQLLEHDRIKVIGVCFGHQIVARAMGAKVCRNEDGWEAAVDNIDLSDQGKQVFGQDTLSLQQMHRDIVYSCPTSMEKLGSSPVCNVQGMFHKGKVITVQGHPEFDAEIVTEILRARHAMGIFNDDEFEKFLDRADQPHGGVLVGKRFVEFLMGDL